MDKLSFEKHQKYVDFYKARFDETSNKGVTEEEFWGLGIENESYIMFQEMDIVSKTFIQKKHAAERYSVDYWKNFRPLELISALEGLPDTIKIPVYINSYFFRHADLLGEHTMTYSKNPQPNPQFSGETIDEYIRRVSPTFNRLMEKNLIYDGDTFEFTTFHFYRATVQSTINELVTVKRMFLEEMNRRIVSKFTIFKQPLIYPPHNYGFAKFLSNPLNVATCNNATYHINITLPTKLGKSGTILNQEQFKAQHANAMRAIQWIEPLLICLYGTPDILHTLDPAYSAGSQRLTLSRYIGLGTYDTSKMEKGKLLDTFKHGPDNSYFTNMHTGSPYKPPETIGYDFNYNKFKNHGIEVRIFDWFPEEHLESVMNLLVLLCQHSLHHDVEDPRECSVWMDFCAKSIRQGSSASVTSAVYLKLSEVFTFSTASCWPFYFDKSPATILDKVAGYLYKKYRSDTLCAKMSPNMKPIQFTNYNGQVTKVFKAMVGKN